MYNDYNYWDQINMIDYNNQPTYQKESSPYEQYLLGNGFPNTYKPYKNYEPQQLDPKDEKEYMLLLLQIYDFAAHELTLYLDTHPQDQTAIKKRMEYVNLAKEAMQNYEMKYGALTLASDSLKASPWQWGTTSFPWEVM